MNGGATTLNRGKSILRSDRHSLSSSKSGSSSSGAASSNSELPGRLFQSLTRTKLLSHKLEIAKPFQGHVGSRDLALDGEAAIVNQLEQFGRGDKPVFDDFDRVDLLFACLAHVASKVPPDARASAGGISIHVRQ